MDSNTFNIFVKHDKSYTLDVTNNMSINKLKELISKKIKIPVRFFYISHASKIIDSLENIINNTTIFDYNIDKDYHISKDCTIYVNVSPHNNILKNLGHFMYKNDCRILDMDVNSESIKLEFKINKNQ
uniref:Ubiquitin-like domain-containing protein n=1 Tax=viral metagenome TaxID=1070528 RepID=A0A6C0JCT2_9ZZZZ